MRARGILVSVLVLILAACGKNEEDSVSTPTPPLNSVEWSITGDLVSAAQGEVAQLTVPPSSSNARLSLEFQVEGGSSLSLSGTEGDLTVRKASYTVNNSQKSCWRGHLTLRSSESRQDFRAGDRDGLLVFEKASAQRVEGTLFLPARETDEAGMDLPEGQRLTVHATFSAAVEAATP
jgi:hypothetical protein